MSFTIPVIEEGTSTTALSVSNSMTGWPSETLLPGEIINRTRSPCEIFSPNSGSLNSPSPERDPMGAVGPATCEVRTSCLIGSVAAGAGAGAGFGGAFVGPGAAAWAGGAGEAFGSAPSTVKITWPTLILSPSLTRISCTVPLTDDGTSTTALSVSNSITDWPLSTFAPGATITRTKS